MDDWKNFPWVVLLVSVIAGMVGGCGAASFQVLTGRQLSVAIFAAYATLGMALGGLALLITIITAPSLGLVHVMLMSGLFGAGSTSVIAAVRYGARVILGYKGLTVEIVVRRKDADA